MADCPAPAPKSRDCSVEPSNAPARAGGTGSAPFSAVRTLILASLLSLVAVGTVRAQGDNAGTLPSDGRVRGDVSTSAGETDRIAFHLDAGASLTLLVTAGFRAAVTLTDPDGNPVDLGSTSGTRIAVKDHPITAGGDYALAIASADGTQGLYGVMVKQRWPRSLAIGGTGPTTVDVAMPAGARFTGVVHGAATAPRITSVRGPTDDELLTAPIGTGGKVTRLPAITATVGGTYHLSVAPSDASPWSGTVRRALPFATPARLDLRNGLDAVSFAGDGVGQLFRNRCAGCHGWAGSYGSVRGYASRAIGRIKAGIMPPGGGLSKTDIALVQAWISTGRNP